MESLEYLKLQREAAVKKAEEIMLEQAKDAFQVLKDFNKD